MTGVLEGVTAGGLKGLFKRLAAKQGAPKAPEAENPGGLKPNLQLFREDGNTGVEGIIKWGKLDVDSIKKIGVPAENSGIRSVTGSAEDALEFFNEQVIKKTIKEVKPGVFIGQDSNGITFTYRASSKSGPPTININGISGLRKIKFIN